MTVPKAEIVWSPTPEQVENSNITKFRKIINEKYSLSLESYDDLLKWSHDNVAEFWGQCWDYVEVKHSVKPKEVVDDVKKLPGAKWFEGARLNFAENHLKFRDDRNAIVFKPENEPVKRITYAELYDEVAKVAAYFRSLGVTVGDRVAGFVPNIPETIICMLAATSIGAMWSSCSPDFGFQGVLDRFGQILPKVLVACDGYRYKGKKIDCLPKLEEICGAIKSLEKVVVLPYNSAKPDMSKLPLAINYTDIKEKYAECPELVFEQLPFDTPVYVMYSSGTTGLPKCIVQGVGVMLNHAVELALHTNITRDDNLFYFTTCGWMMWNWLVGGLAVGCTIVLFEGNPFHPGPGALFEMAQDEKVTVFGTSARFLAAVADTGLKPKEHYDLSTVRALLSTGSPLMPEQYGYVYESISSTCQLASVTGGTDLNGCFALGNPIGSVYKGEIQTRALGKKVAVLDDNGKEILEQKGELCCLAAFPSMPLYFYNDADGSKYHSAYFDVYPGIWRHGDFAEVTASGGMVLYGRSDATLNPGGVRLGTADIYRAVELTFPEVEDSVVVGQDWKDDVRVVLFVKMVAGQKLSDDLKVRIKKNIRDTCSPRHVPAVIVEVQDIPYTINGKKVELAVKKVIQGQAVLNKDALAKPECLDQYKDIPELQA